MSVLIIAVVTLTIANNYTIEKFSGHRFKAYARLVEHFEVFYAEQGTFTPFNDVHFYHDFILNSGVVAKPADFVALIKRVNAPFSFLSQSPITGKTLPLLIRYNSAGHCIVGLNGEQIAGHCLDMKIGGQFPIKHNGKPVAYFKFNKTPIFINNIFLFYWFKIFLVVAIFVLIVSSIIGYFLCRIILNPIKELSQFGEKMKQRKFDTKIFIDSRDEFSELAEVYSDMARNMLDFERMQKNLISDVSHELRSPLANVILETQSMLDGVREFDKKNLQSVADELYQLKALVNDLLQLFSSETGSSVNSLVEIHPEDIFNAVRNHGNTRLEVEGLKVTEINYRNSERFLVCDHLKIYRVFQNLLENACNYTTKPATLEVRFSETEDNCIIEFEDSGPGVSTPDLPHLFERFYRLDYSRNRDTGGSGLGLAICKAIVESHQGSIEASVGSKLGGLLIRIRLPYTQDTSEGGYS